MIIESAANALYFHLPFPPGTANVLAIDDKDDPRLVVWVDKSVLYAARSSLPATFEGFRLEVIERPSASNQFTFH